MITVTLLVFVGILTIIVGAYWLFVVRPETQHEQRVAERLQPGPLLTTAPRVVGRFQELSTIAQLNKALARFDPAFAPLRDLVERSGLRITIGALLLSSALAFALTLFLFLTFPPLVWFAVPAAAGAAYLPFWYLRRAARQRLAAFEELFPEAIDMIARSLRAGHSLITALQAVPDEVAEPVAGEFRLLFERQNFGMSLPEALRAFARRIPLVDVGFFVTAVLTQRETGGDLAEVLDNLALVIRERFRVTRQVRVVSAHGRITGIALALLPPAVAVLLIFISPEHLEILIADPIGRIMLAGAATLQIVGMVIMRKIVNVEY